MDLSDVRGRSIYLVLPSHRGGGYDFVVHFYTVVIPPQIEARDAEKLYASLPIEQDRWRLEDVDGKIFDYHSRLQYRKAQYDASLARGTRWDTSGAIEKVTMTDTTHGIVVWKIINDWESENRRHSDRHITRGQTHWEKINGQWRIVATKILSRSS